MVRRPPSASAAEIDRISYQPPGDYALDIELFTLSEFRRRVSREQLSRAQRLDFHELLYVTEGRCVHMVDFEEWTCKPGALLVLRPGQVQRFDPRAPDCEGWMVLFRAEFLSEKSRLVVHRRLARAERPIVTASLERMFSDTRLFANNRGLADLLRHQLQALLLRLHLAEEARAPTLSPAFLRQRFEAFQGAVDQNLDHAHRVADYAKLLGYSSRSLQRAALEVAGLSAKALVSERVALEAKRLLAHTNEPVAAIAETLGFDEATNFVKFFRREEGQTPGAFRRQHQG